MFVLRLIFFLMAIGVLVCLGSYAYTGHRGYLRLAWQIVKFTGVILVAAVLLFALSRIILL
jgi:hypothetical protein